MTTRAPVLIVGAGISGIACSRALIDAGHPVRIVDRGRVPGGRMATRRHDGRPVDIGASYFTVEPGSAFEAVVAEWVGAGLARPWTDAFAVVGPDGIRETRSGPARYAGPNGLRSLVVALAKGIPVQQERIVTSIGSSLEVDGSATSAVVLAMPDPQAKRLLDAFPPARDALDDGGGWDPVIAVTLGWRERLWARDLHGAFVNDSDAVSFIADDGDRRGDGAPVLVAHSTSALARAHLADPDGAIEPVIAAVTAALGIGARPDWTTAHRWTYAKPAAQHPEPFLLRDGIGVCGDGWGPKSSVAGAWASGTALGEALARQLNAR